MASNMGGHHYVMIERVRDLVLPLLHVGAPVPSTRHIAPLIGFSHVTAWRLLRRALDQAGVEVERQMLECRGGYTLIVTKIPEELSHVRRRI
jgi:hypothetical protein